MVVIRLLEDDIPEVLSDDESMFGDFVTIITEEGERFDVEVEPMPVDMKIELDK